MRFLFVVFLLFFFSNASGQRYEFAVTPDCQKAYRQILSLDFDSGKKSLLKELENRPFNLYTVFVADYIDVLELLLNGDKKTFENRKDKLNQRLKLIEKGPKDSPYYLFTKSALYFHWALVQMRFNEKWATIQYLRKSNKYIFENQKKHKNFAPNLMLSGLMQILADQVPDNFKWLTSLLGFSGDYDSGMQQINHYIASQKSHDDYLDEALIWQTYVNYFNSNDKNQIINTLSKPEFSDPTNLLFAFVKADILCNLGNAQTSIDILNTARNSPQFEHFPLLSYELGKAYCLQVNPKAFIYLNHFFKHYQGNWYRKSAWYYSGLLYLALGKKEKAKNAFEAVLSSEHSGLESDQLATEQCEKYKHRSPILVKATLFIDGGFIQSARAELDAIRPDSLDAEQRLEFYFRNGRCFEEAQAHQKAIEAYQKTYEFGQNNTQYYAARAALQLGRLYRINGETPLAKQWFQKCLQLKNHDRKSSIDQRAKIELQKIED